MDVSAGFLVVVVVVMGVNIQPLKWDAFTGLQPSVFFHLRVQRVAAAAVGMEALAHPQ